MLSFFTGHCGTVPPFLCSLKNLKSADITSVLSSTFLSIVKMEVCLSIYYLPEGIIFPFRRALSKFSFVFLQFVYNWFPSSIVPNTWEVLAQEVFVRMNNTFPISSQCSRWSLSTSPDADKSGSGKYCREWAARGQCQAGSTQPHRRSSYVCTHIWCFNKKNQNAYLVNNHQSRSQAKVLSNKMISFGPKGPYSSLFPARSYLRAKV